MFYSLLGRMVWFGLKLSCAASTARPTCPSRCSPAAPSPSPSPSALAMLRTRSDDDSPDGRASDPPAQDGGPRWPSHPHPPCPATSSGCPAPAAPVSCASEPAAVSRRPCPAPARRGRAPHRSRPRPAGRYGLPDRRACDWTAAWLHGPTAPAPSSRLPHGAPRRGHRAAPAPRARARAARRRRSAPAAGRDAASGSRRRGTAPAAAPTAAPVAPRRHGGARQLPAPSSPRRVRRLRPARTCARQLPAPTTAPRGTPASAADGDRDVGCRALAATADAAAHRTTPPRTAEAAGATPKRSGSRGPPSSGASSPTRPQRSRAPVRVTVRSRRRARRPRGGAGRPSSLTCRACGGRVDARRGHRRARRRAQRARRDARERRHARRRAGCNPDELAAARSNGDNALAVPARRPLRCARRWSPSAPPAPRPRHCCASPSRPAPSPRRRCAKAQRPARPPRSRCARPPRRAPRLRRRCVRPRPQAAPRAAEDADRLVAALEAAANPSAPPKPLDRRAAHDARRGAQAAEAGPRRAHGCDAADRSADPSRRRAPGRPNRPRPTSYRPAASPRAPAATRPSVAAAGRSRPQSSGPAARSTSAPSVRARERRGAAAVATRPRRATSATLLPHLDAAAAALSRPPPHRPPTSRPGEELAPVVAPGATPPAARARSPSPARIPSRRARCSPGCCPLRARCSRARCRTT